MKKVLWGTSASTVLLLISFALSAEDSSVSMQQLQQCREYTDIEERLACFDNIGKQTSVAEAEADAEITNVAAAAVIAAEVEPTTDAATQSLDSSEDFGLPKNEEELDSIHANVSRCGVANDRKFYFYLDNGQVWRYIGGKRLRYKDCDSPAILKEDSMGYELKLEGKGGLRVQRVK